MPVPALCRNTASNDRWNDPVVLGVRRAFVAAAVVRVIEFRPVCVILRRDICVIGRCWASVVARIYTVGALIHCMACFERSGSARVMNLVLRNGVVWVGICTLGSHWLLGSWIHRVLAHGMLSTGVHGLLTAVIHWVLAAWVQGLLNIWSRREVLGLGIVRQRML